MTGHDPALAMDVEALTPTLELVTQATDPWLERRRMSWGASDVAPLLVALGRRPMESVPIYMRANAKRLHTRMGDWPRIVLEKAGARAGLAAGEAAAIGTAREQELLDAWRSTLTDGDALDAATVKHSSSVPRWMWPKADLRCRSLAVSLDAWCLDCVGELAVVELKCGRITREECPWYWRAQILAQMAATDAALGVVVCGQGWSRSMDATGPIDAWPVERDEAAIAEIRDACSEGWEMVQDVKNKMEAM